MSLWISLEGSVASGKSTFIERLASELRLVGLTTCIVKEPVDKWLASGILKHSYENPQIWGYPFQTHVFVSRINEFQKVVKETASNPPAIFLSERSSFIDKVFWDTNLALGRVDPKLNPFYVELWSTFQRLLPICQPHLFLYLNTPPKTCQERRLIRNRSAEDSLDLSYLDELYKQHEAVFSTGEATMPSGAKVPVLQVDGLQPLHKDDELIDKIAQEIISKLLSLKLI